jgi:hypothetical protein
MKIWTPPDDEEMNIRKKRLIIVGLIIACGILFPVLSFMLYIELLYMQPPKQSLPFPFTYLSEAAILFSIIPLYVINLMSNITTNHYILGTCFFVTQLIVYFLIGWIIARFTIREKKSDKKIL